MARKGNNGNHGNENSGRKSAYGERADAELLWNLFTDPEAIDGLRDRVMSGKYSILDRMVLSALDNNERFISDMFKKLFPDTLNLTQNLNQKQMKEIEGNIRDILDTAAKTGKRAAHNVDREAIVRNIGEAETALRATRKITARRKTQA